MKPVQGRRLTAVSLNVKRANGRVDKIGVVAGGHWWQRLVSRLKIYYLNLRSRARR